MGATESPTAKELRAEAKAWGLKASGSKDDLSARIDEHREHVSAGLAERSDEELLALATAHDLELDDELEHDALVAALVDDHLAWHDGEDDGEDDGESADTSGFTVKPVKGSYGVFRGDELITRIDTREQGEEYIARLNDKTKGA